MMIRAATLEDFEQILDLCAIFWKETQFKETFERAHTLDMVNMAYEHGLLCVLEVEDVIEGFAAGVKAPLLGSSRSLTGTELAWWVNPEHRKGGNGFELLGFIEGMAKDLGVKYWNMVSMQSSMPEAIDKMYQRMGYKLSEKTYTKVL